MASVNRVILIGNLGKDAELTHTGTGRPKVSFTMATNRNYKDKEGQWQKDTEWHRVVAWGDMARNRADWLRKGRQVFVEGRIHTRSWDDDKGQKRYMTEVNAWQLLLLGPREDGLHAEHEPAEEALEESSPF